MKNVRMIMIGFFFPLTVFAQQPDFSWLEGTWKLQGKNVFEIWSKTDGTLKGKSYRITNADTTVMETITLRERDGNYFYVPDVKENNGEVEFRMTSISPNGFVAENAAHDFPKLIRYTIVREEKMEILHASIEGDGRVVHYTFEKVR